MIGVIVAEALLYDCQSLKEKRSVSKSVSSRLSQRFNIAIAETDHYDRWQRIQWTVVTVSNERQHAEKELNRVIRFMESQPEMDVTTIDWEWL
ncbi:DUF503 domain-containing protein [Salisediminibacterium selenitireducens]|uniref:YlxP-like protein n=1 Tax=Bacillus selenitireducens (strain ATCC 700615 / DSM 15326 / MLS10) TaxID=439292 RepID=D6XU10_BACIE|nr:DUF503 domain-containing protein [Salisediminibacterium selenitireducens]ADH99296.1 protein of unknown function DUF503 [[Bacillus] selenitireducens MLS10]